MSFKISALQKSTESEREKENNEIRIDDICLPPNKYGQETTVECEDFRLGRNASLTPTLDREESKTGEYSLYHICSEFESSGNDVQCKPPSVKNTHTVNYLPESISNIGLPQVPSVSKHSRVDVLSHSVSHTENSLSSKNSVLPNNLILCTENNQTALDAGKSMSVKEPRADFYSQNFNQSIMSSTSDIPLPGPRQDIETPPLPAYEPKVPTLPNITNKLNIAKIQEETSVNISVCDTSLENSNILNMNIEADKFDLEVDSCYTNDISIKTSGSGMADCKTCSPQFDNEVSSLTVDKNKMDDIRYSPSRLDSDEDNHEEFTAIKPKVLGKEQAKKRLMAFSLSKQQNSALVKKQNKLAVVNKTGEKKPPNPNKSAGVQEQFRATISAIEEEKKRMMQNMPNYLFLYKNNLSNVSNSVIQTTIQAAEKSIKDEGIDSECVTKTSVENEKDIPRSKSTRASPDRSKSSSQRSSSSRRRSSSRSRKHAKEKEEKSERNEYDSHFKKMDSLSDWKTFSAAGLSLGSNFRRLKLRFEEKQRRKDRRRSRSSEEKLENKPVFNYLKKGYKMMTALQAKSSNPGINITVPFQEKTVKFTKTKPMITWAENPSYASDFFMTMQMLLENCDKNTSSILHQIMEQKIKADELEIKECKQRSWYPRFDYLRENQNVSVGRNGDEVDVEELNAHQKNEHKEKAETYEKLKKPKSDTDLPVYETGGRDDEDNGEGENGSDLRTRERRVSLVDDDYLSDVESNGFAMKEMLVGDVKVHLDVELNRVKVRSKWDSDYEGEETEKAAWKKSKKTEDVINPSRDGHLLKDPLLLDTKNEEIESVDNEVLYASCDNHTLKASSQNNNMDLTIQGLVSSELPVKEPREKLVSEYEEFMKMVSFETDFGNDKKSVEVPTEKLKLDLRSFPENEKIDKAMKKIETTEWDQDSDGEEKTVTKKLPYSKGDTDDDFSLLSSSYASKKQRRSESPVKNISDKIKNKVKNTKPSIKNKKKKKRESSSSESSSDSSDTNSDSDTESTDSEYEKRKRKKRQKKLKKKHQSSSSDSDSRSDSKDSRYKKNKIKRKKNKGKKDISADSSDSDEESQRAMLKQLDFKKQEIIKKIEEIDSISNRSTNKKEKRKNSLRTEKNESSESEEKNKLSKQDKKKLNQNPGKYDRAKLKAKDSPKAKYLKSDKTEAVEHCEALFKTCGDSPVEKNKKKLKRQKSSSTSSSDDSKENHKLGKLGKKFKKYKKRDYSSTSDSESDSCSRKTKKKIKKKKKKRRSDVKKLITDKVQKMRDWNDHLLSDGPDFKTGNSLTEEEMPWSNKEIQWNRRKAVVPPSDKDHKDLGDWEESSPEDSPNKDGRSCDSNWDEEMVPKPAKNPLVKDNQSNESKKRRKEFDIFGKELLIAEKDKFLNDFNLESKHGSIINESSPNNLNNETSKCIYSSENSASLQLFPSLRSESPNEHSTDSVPKRNFQGIGSDFHQIVEKKPLKQELYSPGNSDSDLSDEDNKCGLNNKENITGKPIKEDIYDPLNSDSDNSLVESSKAEVSQIPLPHVSDILLPGEVKEEQGMCTVNEVAPDSFPLPSKDRFRSDFVAVPVTERSEETTRGAVLDAPILFKPLEKKRIISVKLQQKFQHKVASVFQSDSEEEQVVVEPTKRIKSIPNAADIENVFKGSMSTFNKDSENPIDAKSIPNEVLKKKDKEIMQEELEQKRSSDRYRDGSRERSRSSYKSGDKERSNDRHKGKREKYDSPCRRSRTPQPKLSVTNEGADYNRRDLDHHGGSSEKSIGADIRRERDPRNSHFKLNFSLDCESSAKKLEDSAAESVRPIPVLTGLDVRSQDGFLWERSHLSELDIGYSCDRLDLLDSNQGNSYKVFGSHDGKSEDPRFLHLSDKYIGRLYDGNCEADVESSVNTELDSLMENRGRKDKRKSRSRSFSPRRRRRSRTPDRRRSPRNRSPMHRSVSPRRRGRSPYSPRRRGSPRRKSPGRRYRSSRSPERKKSRSPRKRRHSPSRRSRSLSPRKHRSPKRRLDSPRRRSPSPRKSASPRIDGCYPLRDMGAIRNRIQVIGIPKEDIDIKMSPLAVRSPRYDSPMGFTRSLADSTISDSELNNPFYNREYPGEFGGQTYTDEVTVNNLITLQNHDVDKQNNSPKRLTLDQRIEMELGVPPGQNDQYHLGSQSYPQFPEGHNNQYPTSYTCEGGAPPSNNNGNQNYYPNQVNSDFNGQFFSGQQPPSDFRQFPQYPRHNPPSQVQNSVLQVGNIMEVVPTIQAPPPPPAVMTVSKSHQIMQVGNVLQVVPSPKTTPGPPLSYGSAQSRPSPTALVSPVKTQDAVRLPQSTVPVPQNTEAIINPLIKAIQLEREKRKKEKEKRRAEREARRKARQLRREAKLMSVNEKLKKSVQDEGLMLGQEVDEDELLEEMEHPSPPIPVEIITDSSLNCLPPAGKGILITAGFIPKPASEKKEVKFADGVCPGEGTSTSGGEDRASPPPKPKLPKEKRYKKKKTKLKKKVKVHIIRQVIQDDEDEDEDDLSPPPPPPGDPPPVFFARFPFSSKSQYPVYQTQTTTTTLTTVQFPTQSFQ